MKTNSRQKQKERTREALLEAAYQVFTRQGIMKSRMEDIAREALVSHGTVFVHFKSQEELIIAVADRFGREVAARTHELMENRGSLKDVLQAHLQGIGMYEGFYTRLLLEARHLPQGVRDSMVSLQSILSLHFSRALALEGLEEKTQIPSFMLFNLWIGLVHHYLANGDLFAPNASVIERCGDLMLTSYLRLLDRKKEEQP